MFKCRMYISYYQGLIDWRRGHTTVHLAKFKPCLKIVTVSTVSIGTQPAKVTKYSINYTIAFEFCLVYKDILELHALFFSPCYYTLCAYINLLWSVKKGMPFESVLDYYTLCAWCYAIYVYTCRCCDSCSHWRWHNVCQWYADLWANQACNGQQNHPREQPRLQIQQPWGRWVKPYQTRWVVTTDFSGSNLHIMFIVYVHVC